MERLHQDKNGVGLYRVSVTCLANAAPLATSDFASVWSKTDTGIRCYTLGQALEHRDKLAAILSEFAPAHQCAVVVGSL